MATNGVPGDVQRWGPAPFPIGFSSTSAVRRLDLKRLVVAPVAGSSHPILYSQRRAHGLAACGLDSPCAGELPSPQAGPVSSRARRSGYSRVERSAPFGGVFPASLKTIDAERYGSLSHPGDSFSYDIYSQAAQAVRNPVGLDPLDGLVVKYMIGVGEFQSAGRMATYAPSIPPSSCSTAS